MNDSDKNFHEIALKSMLFKGHVEWYFCYLKAEKIAHVLALLSARSAVKDSEALDDLVEEASRLPQAIVHFSAGEADGSLVLADLFGLLSAVRIASSRGYLHPENASVLAREYEELIRKVVAESHPSPFISSNDFVVDELPTSREPLPFLPRPMGDAQRQADIKDTDKGHKSHSNGGSKVPSSIGSERASLILDFVRKNKEVSIKDISGAVRGCSEKTIQRELGELIKQGLVERRGERRWSTYRATSRLS